MKLLWVTRQPAAAHLDLAGQLPRGHPLVHERPQRQVHLVVLAALVHPSAQRVRLALARPVTRELLARLVNLTALVRPSAQRTRLALARPVTRKLLARLVVLMTLVRPSAQRVRLVLARPMTRDLPAHLVNQADRVALQLRAAPVGQGVREVPDNPPRTPPW